MNSMVLTIVRSALRNKTGLTEINNASFIFNYLENKMVANITGINSESKEDNISSNTNFDQTDEFSELLTGKVGKSIKYDKLEYIVADIDFIKKEFKCSAYYIKSGNKERHEELITF